MVSITSGIAFIIDLGWFNFDQMGGLIYIRNLSFNKPIFTNYFLLFLLIITNIFRLKTIDFFLI